jgi:uncharacterized protein YjeT (DUF2065 family)
MDISWSDLGAAFALMLIVEGLLPFINPKRFRQILEMANQVDENSIRIMGAVGMGLGLIFLYWARG